VRSEVGRECATIGGAGAGRGVLDLARCDKMIEAESAGRRRSAYDVLAVVDSGGNLLELRRMDNALLVSTSLAPRKAYTAVALRMPPASLQSWRNPARPYSGLT